MQLVIDIDDNLYTRLFDNGDEYVADMRRACVAIRKGTQLPKGHGDLKDIGECNRKLFYQQCGGANSLITVKTAFDMLLSLPTILKADKAESEE